MECEMRHMHIMEEFSIYRYVCLGRFSLRFRLPVCESILAIQACVSCVRVCSLVCLLLCASERALCVSIVLSIALVRSGIVCARIDLHVAASFIAIHSH